MAWVVWAVSEETDWWWMFFTFSLTYGRMVYASQQKRPLAITFFSSPWTAEYLWKGGRRLGNSLFFFVAYSFLVFSGNYSHLQHLCRPNNASNSPLLCPVLLVLPCLVLFDFS